MTFKKRFENYWYYYKWHTIAGITALVLIITTVVECAQKVEPDLSIAYIGYNYIFTDAFQEDMSAIVGDINGDGKERVFCDNVTLPREAKTDADLYVIQKVTILFASGDTRLFIGDREVLEPFLEGFMPLESVLPEEKLEGALEYNGDKVAMRAAECPLLRKYSLAEDNLYVGILSEWSDKKLQLPYEASIALLKALAR